MYRKNTFTGSDIVSDAGKDVDSRIDQADSPVRSAAGDHWDEEDELEDYLKRKLATLETSKSPVSASRAGEYPGCSCKTL